MTADPIKAALAEAERAFNTVNEITAASASELAPAIAAFLRAAPDVIPLGKDMQVTLSRTTRVLLAQEVERAAREGGG